MLLEYGQDWSKKKEISSSKLQFGSTFAEWTFPVLHAAVYFGKDNQGQKYYFSKNGNKGPLVVESTSKLSETYYLWDWTRTNYSN